MVQSWITVLVLLLGALQAHSSEIPKLRRFVPFTKMLKETVSQGPSQMVAALNPQIDVRSEDIRVLQFNMLADGLSGLREDLGDFSRVAKEELAWKSRGQ